MTTVKLAKHFSLQKWKYLEYKTFDWWYGPKYKSCCKSNASDFITLAHNIGVHAGSKGWTFPPILHYILLSCDRWQQRGSVTKWHLTWKRLQIKGVLLNSSMWKKLQHWHSLVFAEHLRRPNCGIEHSEACFSSGNSDTKGKPHPGSLHRCHTMKWRVSLSAHSCESDNGGDYVAK